ncbi:MAG: ATP-dependent metallopeptidase FtsH/Yme1/Tma family protein [Thalassovita sp.]
MFSQFRGIIIVAVLGFVVIAMFASPRGAQSVDMGQVLDRTEFALTQFEGHLDENKITEVSDNQVDQFSGYLTDVLNSEPRFHSAAFGINVQPDAKFLGFEDANDNGVKDDSETDLFTVEIDEANNRLIGTDMSGNSTGMGFSGSGFLTGMLIGNLLSRQRSAGVTANSFNNRSVAPRSSYRAPSASARSGGLRAGK